MEWKTLSKIEIVNKDGETENIEIRHDGNFYKIQNEFGNVSFEFDVSSGHQLAEELLSIITSDINDEIMQFLNAQERDDDKVTKDNNYIKYKTKQVDLFEKPKGLKITKNSEGFDHKANK